LKKSFTGKFRIVYIILRNEGKFRVFYKNFTKKLLKCANVSALTDESDTFRPFNLIFHYLYASLGKTKIGRERDKHRKTKEKTEKHREMQRNTEKDQEKQRKTKKEGEIQRKTDKDRQRQTKTDKDRDSVNG
jgi:hypothetical protein